MNTDQVCANCGLPVVLNRHNKPQCLRCGKGRKDQSGLAPSLATIDELKRELREQKGLTHELSD